MNLSHVLFAPVPRTLAYSSLGFHAALAGLRGCETAFVATPGSIPVTIETGRKLSDFDCVFASVAWELEIPVMYRAIEASGICPVREARPATDPLVVAGGPMTLSNPEALSALCDAVFVGEADAQFNAVLEAVSSARSRRDALERLAAVPGMMVPEVHGMDAQAPEPVRAPQSHLPARTVAADEPNEFGDAFLVEVGRGCPRACTFCVAGAPGRKTSFVPASRVVDAVPPGASRVGLVGTAVSDHPGLKEMLAAFLERGASVTLSSVRADRVDDETAALLAETGLRTLTVAADGPSERLRRMLRKGVTGEDLRRCASLASAHGIGRLKIYVMVGLPTETDEDVAEFAGLAVELSRQVRLSLSVSPFVPKRFTPLQEAPFAGTRTIKRRIALLRRLVHGRARISSASPRSAEMEWRLGHARAWEAVEIVQRIK